MPGLVRELTRPVPDDAGEVRLPGGNADEVRLPGGNADEVRLPGGNAGGAVLVDGTVRRRTGAWTPSVHAVLSFLAEHGFDGAPRVLGRDDHDREVLSYLVGQTVGTQRPWPAWVRSDHALGQVGRWLRRYHDVIDSFVPPGDARWRATARAWLPGDVIGHNDAAPYNAVWTDEGATTELVGFIDWDFAGPCPPVQDLAFVAFSWVPLHARRVVSAEGFTAFGDRARRLRLLLDAYRFTGTADEVLDAVEARVRAHIDGLRAAAAEDPVFTRLVDAGAVDDLEQALVELAADRTSLR